jgi:putative aldouronate transport system substrate-binding protein
MFIQSFIPKLSAEDAACYLEFATPGWKDAFKAMNQAYNDGTIEPQFAIDKAGQLLEKSIMRGRAGAFIWNWDYPYRANPGLASELKKIVPDSNLVPFDPFVDAQGKHKKTKYNPNGMYIFVPRFSKHPKEAIQYLNWMVDLKNLKFLQNGVKGQQYLNETAGGIPKDFIDPAKLPDAQKYNVNDLSIISNGKEYGSDAMNAEALALSYSGYEEQVKQSYIIAMTDAIFPFHFEKIITASATYTPIIRTKGAQLFAKSVVCPVSDFDKTYDALYKEWYEAGADKIMAERRAAYKEQIAKAKK